MRKYIAYDGLILFNRKKIIKDLSNQLNNNLSQLIEKANKSKKLELEFQQETNLLKSKQQEIQSYVHDLNEKQKILDEKNKDLQILEDDINNRNQIIQQLTQQLKDKQDKITEIFGHIQALVVRTYDKFSWDNLFDRGFKLLAEYFPLIKSIYPKLSFLLIIKYLIPSVVNLNTIIP